MNELARLFGFSRTPEFLIEVPAASVDDFPEAELNELRPRRSQLIFGAWISPVLGLLVACWSWLFHNAPRLGQAAFLVSFIILLLLTFAILGINNMSGSWTMFLGATISAPLMILVSSGTVRAGVITAAVLALVTFGAKRAYNARGVRFQRLSPIFASHNRIDGAIVKVTVPPDSDPAITPELTIAAGGRLITASYAEGRALLPAIGYPVTVWVCDQAPDIAVMCINRDARGTNTFRPMMKPY